MARTERDKATDRQRERRHYLAALAMSDDENRRVLMNPSPATLDEVLAAEQRVIVAIFDGGPMTEQLRLW